MKKNLLLALGLSVFTLTGFSQANNKKPQHECNEKCGVMHHEQYLQQINPNRKTQREQYEQQLQEYMAANKINPQTMSAVVTVPVVVHVVYQNNAENISDPQVLSQITVLNQDFGRTNTDANQTPSAFAGVAANCSIQFCMAQRDPQGNPTNGITRTQTTLSSFSTNDAVKFTSQGGRDAWPTTQYINIWVCDLSGGILGYGEFPTGSPSNTFGLVCDYAYFGTTGNVSPPFNLGRTATHEIGHCFNLFHIWGDDGTSCSGSDQCADTPNQADENYGCPTFPNVSCTNGPNGDMHMNYMDYTDDACMNMFTQGQSTRMNAVLSTTPYNALTTSNGCQPVNQVGLDAGIFGIISPSGNLCSTTFTPQVTLRNFGTTALTSCVINYRIDNNTNQTFNWTGNLATNTTTNVTLPPMTTTGGAHTFTAFTTNPNNGTDGQSSNDQMVGSFNVFSSGQNLPFIEGFEGTAFVPPNWTLNNPDASTTWIRTTTAAKTGVASASIDNYNYNASGERDEMVTPPINLSSMQSPQLTFQVAYRMYTDPASNPNFSDSLRVLVSTDCGVTYTSIYFKFGTQLTTITPTFSNTQFVPTQNQWRMETVSLTSYASSQNAIFKFRNITQYENMLYIDDININGVTSINENILNANINVFPNPANTEVFVDIANITETDLTIKVYDVVGQLVDAVMVQNTVGGTYRFNMADKQNGVYFIEVSTNGGTVTKKLLLTH
jgi:hypothetical protein